MNPYSSATRQDKNFIRCVLMFCNPRFHDSIEESVPAAYRYDRPALPGGKIENPRRIDKKSKPKTINPSAFLYGTRKVHCNELVYANSQP
jgi:hypothetical protein